MVKSSGKIWQSLVLSTTFQLLLFPTTQFLTLMLPISLSSLGQPSMKEWAYRLVSLTWDRVLPSTLCQIKPPHPAGMRAAGLLQQINRGRGCCLRRVRWGRPQAFLKAELLWMSAPSGSLITGRLTQPGSRRWGCPEHAGHPREEGGWTTQVGGEKEGLWKWIKEPSLKVKLGSPEGEKKSHTCISCSLPTAAGRKRFLHTSNNELPTTPGWSKTTSVQCILSLWSSPLSSAHWTCLWSAIGSLDTISSWSNTWTAGAWGPPMSKAVTFQTQSVLEGEASFLHRSFSKEFKIEFLRLPQVLWAGFVRHKMNRMLQWRDFSNAFHKFWDNSAHLRRGSTAT